MTCGIYSIVNLVNHKRYIGQSINIEKRFYRHQYDLNNNKHYNQHLQRAWNKYGVDNFDFLIIEICHQSQLDEKEQYYILHYDSLNNGYNNDSGGTDGRIVSEETKQKISDNHHDVSGINNPMYGRKHKKTSVEKIRNNMRDVSGENNPMYGRKHTDNAKKKISNIHRGKTLSQEHIQKLKSITGKEHHSYKDYPRITKGGKKNGKQVYILFFNGKRILESTNKDNMNILLNTDGFLCLYYYNFNNIPDGYLLPNIAIQYIPYYKNKEYNRIHTKFLNVTKNKDHHTKQGFVYVYRTKVNGKKVKISRVDIKKLEKVVKEKGYEWREI